MSGSFVEEIKNGLASKSFVAIGYSEAEISKISEIYDINISGQLKSFLHEMGRSDGGLVGEYYIHLYKPQWGMREQLDFQISFRKKLVRYGLEKYLKKPFVFAWLEERFYYFVLTEIGEDHCVYQFDDENEDVVRVGENILDFLRYIVDSEKGKEFKPYVGDMLK